MPYSPAQNVSQAFGYLIKNLCIDEFPCGQGNWRSGNKWRCDSPDLLNPLKEPDANLESIQSLKELSYLHPFTTTADWSEDIASLRQKAIENPEKLNMKCMQKYFTTLRLSSMNINDVDEGLLKFCNLKELTLAANVIEKLNSDNLPKQLEVLELYGNKLSDIKMLVSTLPSLVHFGIGLNSLSSIIGSIQPNSWSNMMSLDLSYNELIMLKETLETLKLLPKLNNLLLQGNPLSLLAGYRGLVVDTLKQLSILDDTRVSADEKHRYKSTSKLKGLPADDAIIDVNINLLKGIQRPQEEENENGEEFPRTEYRYQLFYSFPSKSKMKRKASKDCGDLEKEPSESGSLNRDCEDKGSNCDSDDEFCPVEITAFDADDYLRPRKTNEKHWSDDSIDFNYEATFVVSDMRDLKKYFSNGILLKIVENKVLVSPEPPPEDSASVTGDGELDKNKLQKRKIAKDKPSQAPPAKVTGKDIKPRGKKKGKGEDIDLFELSRESKVIAEKCLSVEDFISGLKRLEVQTVFTLTEKKETDKGLGSEESKDLKLSSTKQSLITDSKRKSKDNTKLSPSASIQRNKSAMSTKMGKPEKNAKIKDSKPLTEIAEAEGYGESLQDITLDITINLHTWKTAKEAQDWITQNETIE